MRENTAEMFAEANIRVEKFRIKYSKLTYSIRRGGRAKVGRTSQESTKVLH